MPPARPSDQLVAVGIEPAAANARGNNDLGRVARSIRASSVAVAASVTAAQSLFAPQCIVKPQAEVYTLLLVIPGWFAGNIHTKLS